MAMPPYARKHRDPEEGEQSTERVISPKDDAYQELVNHFLNAVYLHAHGVHGNDLHYITMTLPTITIHHFEP